MIRTNRQFTYRLARAETTRLFKKDNNSTSNALIGSAVLFLVPGVIYWSIHGVKLDLNDWVRIIGSAALLGMGIAARWTPLVPAIVCLVLYAALVGLQLVQGTATGLIVWILQGTTLLLLLIALVAAVRRRSEP